MFLTHEPAGERESLTAHAWPYSSIRKISPQYSFTSFWAAAFDHCQHIFASHFSTAAHTHTHIHSQQKVVILTVIQATEVFIGDLLVSLVGDYSCSSIIKPHTNSFIWNVLKYCNINISLSRCFNKSGNEWVNSCSQLFCWQAPLCLNSICCLIIEHQGS